MNQTCYLCGSDQNKIIFKEHDIPILECSNCGHIFSSYVQEEHYDGYWDSNSELEYDLEWWDVAHREIYSEFISTFIKKDSGTILDVGCGLGFFVKMMQTKKPNWTAIGFEMSEKAVQFAKEKNNLDSVFPGMIEKSGLGKNSVDIITLWDVIEHIPKPQPLLNYLYSILKPGGFLFLQTPNARIQLLKANLKVILKGMKPEIHYLEAKDHINNYSMKTLNDLAIQTQFKQTDFYIMKPILSVAGSKNKMGTIFKLVYYHVTRAIWFLSFKKINLNNTLFALLKK